MATLNDLNLTSLTKISFDDGMKMIENIRYQRNYVRKKPKVMRKKSEPFNINELSLSEVDTLLDRLKELGVKV